jgi:sugar lactone lactonase YvrE
MNRPLCKLQLLLCVFHSVVRCDGGDGLSNRPTSMANWTSLPIYAGTWIDGLSSMKKNSLINSVSARQRDMQCIAATKDVCGEGVVWHPDEDAIYWADINRRLLHRYTPASSDIATWEFDQPVTAVTLTEDPDLLLLVLGGSVILWNTHSCSRSATLFQLSSWPAARCNDARVGPDGALWFGTMQNNVSSDGGSTAITESLGELLCLDRGGRTQVWHTGIGITNTVAWSPAGDRLYFGDTLRNCIYVSDFDGSLSSITSPAIFTQGFHRGLPDGSAMDSQGYLWNCRYGGGCIVRFAPDGSATEVIETPVKNPTTCAFGGPDLDTLYVTSAISAEARDGDKGGALFSMEVDVTGLPSNRFHL